MVHVYGSLYICLVNFLEMVLVSFADGNIQHMFVLCVHDMYLYGAVQYSLMVINKCTIEFQK